jgi:hypothetical protein
MGMIGPAQHDLGYFGNIWVRQNNLTDKGDSFPGHTHVFDHVSLLARGSVLVEVEGYEPKVFEAPTFIVIKKEMKHKFTALEDNVLYYCVFALRDVDGEVIEIYDEKNSPTPIHPFSASHTDGSEYETSNSNEKLKHTTNEI